ncbi:hypothetical protein ACTI_67530 [Actinoplanes sp. OR16]|uniref:SMI1/KNR4 family protein n=1 Tax=Actinoplanes sp. OR16 TaxID=946334 RepID=UPI000F71199F|nr:SMI1/KNR4 family protein [Actinoplanes sp. OR16]BBH70068.1 hypothetical protein ACTI_67530 [Actinoplanes sp. OR16]
MEIDESWRVILDHIGRRCPDVLDGIRPPAADADLRAAEEAVGGPLPDDLARWWRLADGARRGVAIMPQVYAPMSVADSLARRETWRDVSAELAHHDPDDRERCLREPAGSPCHGWWLPQWLPIGSDFGGDTLFVDLRPGPERGCVGEFHTDGWDYRRPLWPSVTVMLAEVAASARSGALVRGFRLRVDEDGVEWDF